MPTPTISDVQPVDPILTNMLIGYQQADARFLASRIMVPVPVDKDSGTYMIFTKKYFFFDDLRPRAPGGPFQELNFAIDSATYLTLQVAGAIPLADEILANSQVPFDLIQAGLKKLSQASLIRKEVAFAADFMVTGVWGTSDNNSATDWDDFAAGDPVNDVKTASRTISNNTGTDPNTMALGYIVDQALTLHPDILDRLKYTQGATQKTIDMAMAAIFGKDNYFVGKASYSNTNESAAFSGTAIVDDDCLVCHVDPGAGLYGATAGKTFYWEPGGGLGGVRQWRDESSDSEKLKHKEQWDQKAVATDLGYFFADIV